MKSWKRGANKRPLLLPRIDCQASTLRLKLIPKKPIDAIGIGILFVGIGHRRKAKNEFSAQQSNKTTFLGLWVFVLSFLLLPPYLRAQNRSFSWDGNHCRDSYFRQRLRPEKRQDRRDFARIIPPHPRGPGYQDWTVELRRFDGKPFDRDHAIRAKIILSYDENGPSAEIDVPLKQGAIIASQTFHVPCWFYPYYWQARFYSNGYELKGLRSNFQNFSVFQSHVENNRLFVFDDDDDEKAQAYLEEYSGQLTSLLVEYRKSEIWCIPLNGNQTNPGTQSANTADIAMRSRLPQDWLSYSRYAALVLTKDALEKIDSAQAEALALI